MENIEEIVTTISEHYQFEVFVLLGKFTFRRILQLRFMLRSLRMGLTGLLWALQLTQQFLVFNSTFGWTTY
jgi:hypothetical protein